MFFIFGWNNVKTKDYGPSLLLHCGHCDNVEIFHHVKISKWFSLFFVPIFPYESDEFIICPICSSAYPINERREEYVEKGKKLYLDYEQDKISEKDFISKMNYYAKHFFNKPKKLK